ncbi:hypothetical protein O3P69_013918 [Scylla paramamosain]|uniref:Uncharacterized protein n=1 Tax=Scylla paramamosain TaxID=85552 RepID=A0AAW0SQZ9_SCYPA
MYSGRHEEERRSVEGRVELSGDAAVFRRRIRLVKCGVGCVGCTWVLCWPLKVDLEPQGKLHVVIELKWVEPGDGGAPGSSGSANASTDAEAEDHQVNGNKNAEARVTQEQAVVTQRARTNIQTSVFCSELPVCSQADSAMAQGLTSGRAKWRVSTASTGCPASIQVTEARCHSTLCQLTPPMYYCLVQDALLYNL